jgi:L-ascorbate metabolism protein UlaG (beta-lactamase superfamily)
MQIIWHGQSCFQIITNQAKNGQRTIVIDPFDEALGLRVPKLEADILLVTHGHHDHNNVKAVGGNPFLISGPGEYEAEGIFIQGIPAFHDKVKGKSQGENTCYTIEAEEIRLCHLGDLGQSELTEQQLQTLGEIDILMVPVGGIYTIDGEGASKIISQIEPKIVIPMHYQISKLNPSAGGKLEGIEKFLKVMGKKEIESLSKFSIKQKELPQEETEIVVLNP